MSYQKIRQFKLMLIGEQEVGKSTLMNQILLERFLFQLYKYKRNHWPFQKNKN
ncbi:unnamed protein product [Paramecium sonneborni]|uniref:Uncharacterized protein n=1 Tax=Paramecium sonneborni TaxID=65129 RepID=A0A8S1NLP0_9CILI|nr:unnamed protein product [Paramecium sonneborni]